ncbi:MAG: hypothetical protein AAB818_00665 [Patescibacteria group bacterium]
MENRSLKIFTACAIGAWIGSMVALELNRYFWWLGVLLGGFVGYIAYEFKQVLVAIPSAYRVVAGWKPDKEGWRNYGLKVVAIMSLALTIEILTILPLTIFLHQPFLMFFSTIGMLIMAFLLAIVLFEETPEEIIKFFNPLCVFFYWLPKGILWCVRRTPMAIVTTVRFVGKFTKTLFLFIHSDIRLLCGIDAAIGAAIGYFTGDVMVGTVTGGVFGVINYKIVSQKILKLHLSKA